MIDHAFFALTFAAALGSALVAGIFFAFSTFVMQALGRLPPAQGIAAMQSINVTVLNPLFFLAFFGTGLLCVVLALGSVFGWGGPGAPMILIASLLYLLCCIGSTMARNVPLNDRLAAIRPDAPEAAALWSEYLVKWTAWNHLRTVAPIVSAALFMLVLFQG